MINIEDAENKSNNGIFSKFKTWIISQALQTKTQSDKMTTVCQQIEESELCETHEEVCNMKGQVQLEPEERENQINKQIYVL